MRITRATIAITATAMAITMPTIAPRDSLLEEAKERFASEELGGGRVAKEDVGMVLEGIGDTREDVSRPVVSEPSDTDGDATSAVVESTWLDLPDVCCPESVEDVEDGAVRDLLFTVVVVSGPPSSLLAGL